jgi:glycosyltransferase involved in cell wall biosynthesis
MDYAEKQTLEELLDLVKVLEDKHSNPDMEARLLRIKQKYAEINNKDNFWVILDDMCKDIPETYFSLLEYMYAAVKGEEILRKQLEVLTEGVQKGSIDLFYAIFYKWQLIHRNFMTYDCKQLFIERSKLHIELLGRMREFLKFDLPPIDKNERNNNRIVVTSLQLLGTKHGPTRNIMDYCYTLQKKLKKEVFLLIAAEMPSEVAYEYETYGLEYGYFSHRSELDGYFCVEYLGEKINGYQCRINRENRENIRDIIANIYQWKPYLIYNIGSENLVVDLIGSFTEEVSIPCGNVYPVTEARYHILPRKIEERDRDVIDFLTDRNQKVIESIFVYKLEEPIRRYRKSDFQIDDQAFVISIVGTRLDKEINEEFICVLKNVLKLDPAINIVIIGNCIDFEEKREMIGFGDRVKYIGHQSDLRGAFNIADLYLNPPRKGGGTSSVEALAEGVPVITLGNCDVAYSCGEDFECPSLDEMPELIHKYMTDKEFYENQSRKAKVQAETVVDTEEVLRGILSKIE